MLTTDVRHTPITATPRATAMVKRLVSDHGPLAIYQSGGCCDGSLPLCLLADELGQGPNDVLLGHVQASRSTSMRSNMSAGAGPSFCWMLSGAPRKGSRSGCPTHTS